MEFRNFKFSTQRCIESDYSRYTVVCRQVGTVKVKVSTIQFNIFIIFYFLFEIIAIFCFRYLWKTFVTPKYKDKSKPQSWDANDNKMIIVQYLVVWMTARFHYMFHSNASPHNRKWIALLENGPIGTTPPIARLLDSVIVKNLMTRRWRQREREREGDVSSRSATYMPSVMCALRNSPHHRKWPVKNLKCRYLQN